MVNTAAYQVYNKLLYWFNAYDKDHTNHVAFNNTKNAMWELMALHAGNPFEEEPVVKENAEVKPTEEKTTTVTAVDQKKVEQYNRFEVRK